MKTVAFVPIKLNSQRLKNKNILPLGEKSLCWYVLNTLTEAKEIDEVYVYCSDEKIKEYIPENVIFKKRDKRLDGDLVKGYEIYKSFVEEIDADIYVLAHATSPFTRTTSFDNALLQIKNGMYDSAFSAERIQTFAWYQEKPINYELTDVPRTQDIEPVWVETSGFYAFEKNIFVEHGRRIGFKPYIQEVSGMEAVDIDEARDYELAKLFLETEEGKEWKK